jgi:hypothetical protein
MGRLLLAGSLAFFAVEARGQTIFELRGSTTRYRFVDFLHNFKSGLATDVIYIGAPGADELYFGAGYAWKPATGVTVTPLVYGVVGKQDGERGLAACASLFLERGGFRALGFGGHFFKLDGEVSEYDFLDSFDLTRVAGRWEVGVSAGFFHQAGDWNPLIGPTLKLNDKKGTTAFSLRGGYKTELRLLRILTL